MNSIHYPLSEIEFKKKSRLYSVKPLISFLKLVTMFSINTRLEKKYIRVNNTPFMTKTYSKAIIQRTRFRNKLLENPTDLNKVLNRQKKLLYFPSEKERKEYFSKLNEKAIIKNGKFWHTATPFLSVKAKSISLVNNDNIESRETELAEVLNGFLSNIVKNVVKMISTIDYPVVQSYKPELSIETIQVLTLFAFFAT